MKIKISIGADHAGRSACKALTMYLREKNVYTISHGINGFRSADYPDYAKYVTSDVMKGHCDIGILICGTGSGMNIAANKTQGIRAALVYNKDIAILCRRHNNANIICMGVKYQTIGEVYNFTDIFIETQFFGGRHSRRVLKACGIIN